MFKLRARCAVVTRALSNGDFAKSHCKPKEPIMDRFIVRGFRGKRENDETDDSSIQERQRSRPQSASACASNLTSKTATKNPKSFQTDEKVIPSVSGE